MPSAPRLRFPPRATGFQHEEHEGHEGSIIRLKKIFVRVESFVVVFFQAIVSAVCFRTGTIIGIKTTDAADYACVNRKWQTINAKVFDIMMG
jgi:uncharacterized membrane protein YfhO